MATHSIPITPKAGKLPPGYEFTPASYRDLLLQRLKVSLSSDSVILGTNEATVPNFDSGPWWDGSSWWIWDIEKGGYVPADIGIKSGDFGITINSQPTENREIALPDATGTAATLTDIYVPRDTITLTSEGGSVDVDASLSSNFILTLTENTAISLLNIPVGGKIRIAIINDGTSYTVTWPSAGADDVMWSGGTDPAQPSATVGQKALAMYTIRESNVGLTAHLFGEGQTSFTAPNSDPDPIPEPGPYWGGGQLPPPHNPRVPYNFP